MNRELNYGTGCLLLLLVESPAQAYVGPGAGLSAIGGALAVIVALFLLVVGFLWYPIKRMFFSKPDEDENSSQPEQGNTEVSEAPDKQETKS